MKLISFVLASILFTSCMTLNYNGKKRIFLVDAPDDLVVKSKGKVIEIKLYEAFRESTGPKEYRTTTKYKYPGIVLRVKRKNTLEFISNGKAVQFPVKGNPALGIVVMVLEIPFTFGIGPIVDLATTSYFHPQPKYIDVKAVVNGTTPRTKRELQNVITSATYYHVD